MFVVRFRFCRRACGSFAKRLRSICGAGSVCLENFPGVVEAFVNVQLFSVSWNHFRQNSDTLFLMFLGSFPNYVL